jgi:hypothetical protein
MLWMMVRENCWTTTQSPLGKRYFTDQKAQGDEHVLAVTQAKVGVLYFDDVEYGFNISGVDECGDKR